MKYRLFIVFLLIPFFVFSQNLIGLKVSNVCLNSQDLDNLSLFKRKIGNNGKVLFEPGVILTINTFFYGKVVGAKINSGFFIDPANCFAGNLQLFISFNFLANSRNSFSLSLGPSVFYRQSWINKENYVKDDDYNSIPEWQNVLSIISGEIEYDYYISKYLMLSASINHIQLKTIGLTFGMKYSYKPVKKKRHSKPCDCPNL